MNFPNVKFATWKSVQTTQHQQLKKTKTELQSEILQISTMQI